MTTDIRKRQPSKKIHVPAIAISAVNPARVKISGVEYFQRVMVARRLLRWKFFIDREDNIHKIHKFLQKKAYRNDKWTWKQVLKRKKKLNVGTSIGSREILKRVFQLEKQWRIKSRAKKRCNKEPVMEIVLNAKEWKNTTSNSKQASLRRILQVVKKETYNHNWKSVMEQLANLSAKFGTNPSYFLKLWLVWNAGSQALMARSANEVDDLIEFSRHIKTILTPYAPRLYVELGTWIVIKRSFSDGLQLLNDSTPIQTGAFFKKPEFKRSVRKIRHDLIVKFFNAVSSFFLWKRGSLRSKMSQPSGSVFSTRFIEATAMSQFQEVVELAEITGADVTIFVQPMIELLMKIKTEFEAFKFFQDLVQKYDRNYVLEKMYLEFLEEYFPFMKDELRIYRARALIYTWNKKTERSKTSLKDWKIRKSINGSEKSRFRSDI